MRTRTLTRRVAAAVIVVGTSVIPAGMHAAHAYAPPTPSQLIGTTSVLMSQGTLYVLDDNAAGRVEPVLQVRVEGTDAYIGEPMTATVAMTGIIYDIKLANAIPLSPGCVRELRPMDAGHPELGYVHCRNVTGAVSIYMSTGNDNAGGVLHGGHPLYVNGGPGADLLEFNNDAAVTVDGDQAGLPGASDRVIIDAGLSPNVHGGPGDDVMYAASPTSSGAVLHGDDGNDFIYGPTSDATHNGTGFLFGDAGNDQLEGHDGPDILSGGPGDDRLEGSKGADGLIGDSGRDTLLGQLGPDQLFASDGEADAVLNCGDGSDVVHFDHGASAAVKDPTPNGCESKQY